MGRGRLSNEAEAAREALEGDIYVLGNLIVRCGLVKVRLNAGVKIAPDLLAPAVSEMAKIEDAADRVRRRLQVRMEDICQR